MGLDESAWRRDGDAYVIDWAGTTWRLAVDEGRVGLRREGSRGLFLALTGLAAQGRREDGVFRDGVAEIVHGRLAASFEPEGWHDLSVRAAWGRSQDGRGIDLEVQASAASVGRLRQLEILVATDPEGSAGAPLHRATVEPRDRLTAASSYDGRESIETLQRLTTLAIPARDAIRYPSVGWTAEELGGNQAYLEMVHPDDVARRIRQDSRGYLSVRYALFGYDLERGVVLRARFRGLFFPVALPDADREAEERTRFLSEPPPLRTD